MPQSITGSVNSQGSGASAASRQSKRYVKVGRTSEVDESLFGKPARFGQMTGNRTGPSSPPRSDKKLFGRRAQKSSDDPEVVQVITKDLIRTIKVPSHVDPTGRTVILGSGEFSRIKAASRVLTKQERQTLKEAAKSYKEEQQDACNTRKNDMEHMEQYRTRNAKTSDLEQEAQEQSQYLLSKARTQMEEQEDEIKKLNELILNAKCHAIRDAQLEEKKLISKEIQEEEQRLDMMMEIERQRGLEEYEKSVKQKQVERQRGAHVLQKQIVDRQQQRTLDEERRDQEQQAMLQYLDKLQREDMESLQRKREVQLKLMVDVAKANEEIQKIKERNKEREKLEDAKVMEYTKAKAEREAAYLKELELQKIEKEKEIARLRAMQEREQDKQAEKDALRARRHQEAYEREWRKKEREEATKKSETERHLRMARQQQVQHKEHFLAVQAQRDRSEFDRVLIAQEEAVERDRELKRRRHDKRRQHADEVRGQIRQKEQETIQERKSFFDEGIRLDQEARERREKLNQIKMRKLQELREAGIPEKYCAEVSRRINGPPATFSAS